MKYLWTMVIGLEKTTSAIYSSICRSSKQEDAQHVYLMQSIALIDTYARKILGVDTEETILSINGTMGRNKL